MSVTSIRFLVGRAHAVAQKSQDSPPRICFVLSPVVKLAPLSPGIKLAPRCLTRCDQRTQPANVPEWETYNVTHKVQVMDPFVAREQRYRSSHNRPLYSLSARTGVLLQCPGCWRPLRGVDNWEPYASACSIQAMNQARLPPTTQTWQWHEMRNCNKQHFNTKTILFLGIGFPWLTHCGLVMPYSDWSVSTLAQVLV